MTFIQILKEKKELSLKLKKKYNLLLKNKALWLVKINNKALLKKIYFWLANLPINFIIVWDFEKDSIDENFKNLYVCTNIEESNILAFDFVILDSETNELSSFSKNAVVIISPNDNHFSSVLREYNPMKNEWNSYLYNEYNEWSIFHAITRYLENYKITFDNKNLVKNVYEGK